MKIPSKIRSRKLGTKVDLTAMVSVSFLLIIFFMVTIELSKPKIMSLGLPEKSCGIGCFQGCFHGDYRVTTLLLGNDDKIISYEGVLDSPIHSVKSFTYGKKSIRAELFTKNKQVLEYSTSLGRPDRGMIVIIKPSKNCNFKNLVDVLDEMAINNIQSYSILNDFTPEEQKLLDTAKI